MGIERAQLRAIRWQLENRAVGMGARFFGVADLSTALETIVEQGGDFLSALPPPGKAIHRTPLTACAADLRDRCSGMRTAVRLTAEYQLAYGMSIRVRQHGCHPF